MLKIYNNAIHVELSKADLEALSKATSVLPPKPDMYPGHNVKFYLDLCNNEVFAEESSALYEKLQGRYTKWLFTATCKMSPTEVGRAIEYAIIGE